MELEFAIRARVGQLHRPARTYALAIIAAAVSTQYAVVDARMHSWLVLANGALILAVCVVVLEASILVMLPAVEARFRVGELSDVMVWLAVILGVCGFAVWVIQRAYEGTRTVISFRMFGLWLVLKVLMGSIILTLLGIKWHKRT